MVYPPQLLLRTLNFFFVVFFTLVTGPSRSLSLKLSDTRGYEPYIRVRLGTDAHFCGVVVPIGTPQTLNPEP